VTSIEVPKERTTVVANVIDQITTGFDLPVDVIRRSDRFGQDLCLPTKMLQRDAEVGILWQLLSQYDQERDVDMDFGRADEVMLDFLRRLHVEHGITTDQERRHIFGGLRVEDVIDAFIRYEVNM